MIPNKEEVKRSKKILYEEGVRELIKRTIEYERHSINKLLEPNKNIKEIKNGHRLFINEFFDSKKEYNEYIQEWKSEPLSTYLTDAIQKWESAGYSGADNLYYLSLYAYIRKHNPSVLVETGVKDGWATLFILSALEYNNKINGDGRANNKKLYSIDLPSDQWSYRKNKHPGWILPDNLRSSTHWEIRRGYYKKELVRLLDELQSIDLFNHDSIHTTCHMMFEYEISSSYLKKDGVIISDNIYSSDAFDYFPKCHDCKSAKIAGGSDLDEYWWKMKTHSDYPKKMEKPHDNAGIIWDVDD